MIRLGFDVAVAVLLSVVVFVMFVAWLYGRAGRRREPPEAEENKTCHMRQCPYCRHVCVDDQHKKIMICPVCKSYFEEESP